MFSRDRLCRKKTFTISSFLACFLSFGLCALLSIPTNAASLSISSLEFRYRTVSGGSYTWSNLMTYGEYLNQGQPYDSIDMYQWNSSAVSATGNYARIHFETNIVLSQPTSLNTWYTQFVNRSFMRVRTCSTSLSNGALPIKSSSLATVITDWTGPSPTINYRSKTLTVYGDVVVSNVPSGTQNFYCLVDASGYAFIQNANNYSSDMVWFEQQPTSIEFTNDSSDAMAEQQIEAINNTSSAIDRQTDSEQERWEIEREEQNEKEDELEDQSGDLSLSASTPSNVLFRFFRNPFNTSDSSSRCYTTVTIHTWFSASPFTVCSPMSTSMRQFISFASNFILLALILRLYFKKLKGGVDG